MSLAHRVRDEFITVVVGAALGLALAFALLFAEAVVTVRTWRSTPPPAAPTTVWSAPIRLEEGDPCAADDLAQDLLAAGYEEVRGADAPQVRALQFRRQGDTFTIFTPARTVAGVEVPEELATVTLADSRVADVEPGTSTLLLPTRLATVGDLERRRTPVGLDDVSPFMVPAILATEDARFRDHVGIDPLGLLRAVVNNLLGRSLQGGSTLTQQLAKNLFLGQERTLRRKAREAFFAAALEWEHSKDELLALYLSEVYLGHTEGMPLFGVEQAARAFFGKSAKNLTAGEAAVIAGTIASPNQWSPLRSHEAALTRRDHVIDRMVYTHALSEADGEAARAETLATGRVDVSASWRLPWVVAAALDEASRAVTGFTAGAGHAMHTTVQPHLQRAAERAVRDGLDAVAASHPQAAEAEAALVALDPETGRLLAVVGGRDFGRSSFQRATAARRQVGSTVKPLLLLLAAHADPSLGTGTLIEDAPITRRSGGQLWTPGNADGTFLGPIPVGNAIARSRNVPAILLSEAVKLPRVRDALREAGLVGATDLPSVALGAFDATPADLAGAWAALATDGHAVRPCVLHALLDAAGQPLHTASPARAPIGDPAAAAIARAALEEAVSSGTAAGLGRMGVRGPVGAKTGTTDDGRDAWLAAVTPSLVVVGWTGLDRGSLGLAGSTAALPVVGRFLARLSPVRGRFPKADVEAATVCATTGEPPCPDCDAPYEAWFRAGRVPERRCILGHARAPENSVEASSPSDAAEPEAAGERRRNGGKRAAPP